jgi:hypothetical protein
MELRERADATAAFNERASLLLATDAASEGLNLHSRCRLVIHFELPWNPTRLEQRAGRVDRIGQLRRVHEALLVADDTAEQLVLAPLVAKARRARSALPDGWNVTHALAESHVAAAILDGAAPPTLQNEDETRSFVNPPATLRDEALDEVARLLELRHSGDNAATVQGSQPIAALISGCRAVERGLVVVYDVTLVAADGRVVHRELVSARVDVPLLPFGGTSATLQHALRRFRDVDEPRVRQYLQQRLTPRLTAIAARCARAASAAAAREHAILRALPSAATALVQAGLFDQRALRTLSARQQTSAAHHAETEYRLETIDNASRLEPALQWCATLLIAARRP